MVYYEKLTGKLVNLRAIEESDADYTYAIRHDKDKTKYLHPLTGTVEDQRSWIRKSRESAEEYTFIIEDKREKPLGMYGLYQIRGDKAKLGRALMYGTPMQDSEAAVLLHDFALYTLNLQTVLIDIFSENKPSVGMTLRLGGKEIRRSFDEAFQLENVEYIITKESYKPCRDKVAKLIDRFSSRL